MKAKHFIITFAAAASMLFFTPTFGDSYGSAPPPFGSYGSVLPPYLVVNNPKPDYTCMAFYQLGQRSEQVCTPKGGVVFWADMSADRGYVSAHKDDEIDEEYDDLIVRYMLVADAETMATIQEAILKLISAADVPLQDIGKKVDKKVDKEADKDVEIDAKISL